MSLLVVLVFANERGVVSQLLQRRGFARLGELSFSIYLTHAAVIFAFTLLVSFIVIKLKTYRESLLH